MTVDELIQKWWGLKGGAERSNLGPFIQDLCDALKVPHPEPASVGVLGNYEFEGSVPAGSFRSAKATGFVDLYKRSCFVLEAKQSQIPVGQQSSLFEPAADAPQAPSGARYDQLMRDARAQAENYAKNLPGDHPPAPFIIVCDVGRAFEILFDYTGNGRGYGFFPDKLSYRIELPDLAKPGIAERLRNIWIAPDKENPRLRSAEVTSGIARRLAQVSQYLEASNRDRGREAGAALHSQLIEETSLFLMRIIFCMFAEDIGLLPKDRFKEFLEGTIEDPRKFEEGLHDLWLKMNLKGGGYAWAVSDIVKYFNGGLFESSRTFVISNADRGELYQAAKADWKKVEPAIFGTLLEQALTKAERAKLGAHYTPRPYVERLVQATIMDVLEPEWAAIVQTQQNRKARDAAKTLADAVAYHDRLAALRILDPACGTGNFLYVAMEALQQLEAKVIETIETLGGEARAKVGPHQFHGLELNPRAAKIAELVLWIGWLRFRIANGPGDVHDPVLDQTANINFGRHGGYDAVLARGETGEFDAEHPLVPEWPEADFIVGNPPFIGKGAEMRERLGSEYVRALGKANIRVAGSADFVMQWWDRAAYTLVARDSPLRRFGFVTTNSITQEFSRRVIQNYLTDATPAEGHCSHAYKGLLSLVYAIPDHPWLKPQTVTKGSRRGAGSGGPAAVRIAMTVAQAGRHEGRLARVRGEAGLETDTPQIDFDEAIGVINSDLSIGADITSANPLQANKGISCNGVMLAGQGFWIDGIKAKYLIEQDDLPAGSRPVIRPYVGGSDLMQRPSNGFVIDFFGMTERAARQTSTEAYQWILQAVKPDRDKNSDRAFRENWWLFGRNRPEVRSANATISRFIGTTRTSKHRVFQFIDSATLPNHEIVVISIDDAGILGVLSSSIHSLWSFLAGGTLEDRPRYNKARTFDPFPFPASTGAQRQTIAELAEELDATRKAALVDVPGLTMTELYNLRDKLRLGAALSNADRDRAMASRAGVVNRLHEQIDAAVANAYGWPHDLSPAETIARLVALNAERATEEKAGLIRWLRPDYQGPGARKKGG